MNTVKACVLAAFGVAALGGCTTTRTRSVSVENKAAPVYAQRRPWLQSAQRNLVARWLLTPADKTQLSELLPSAFLLVARNGGDQTIGLARGDIMATVEGRPIHVLTPGEYRGVIDRQASQASATIRAQRPGLGGEVELAERWVEREDGQVDHLMPEIILTPGVDGAPVERLRPLEQARVNQRRDTLLADVGLMLPPARQAIAPGRTFACVVRLTPSNLSSGRRLRILVKAGEETHEFACDIGT